MKLSMSIDRLPDEMSIPVKNRGLLQARICVSDKSYGRDITLLADRHDEFDLDDIRSMLRVFSTKLEQPKVA